MTVSSQTNKIRIVGNGVASAFPLPFRFFANSEISALFVERATGVTTPAAIGTDYTLTGAGDPEFNGSATGVLTTTVPLAATRDLIILRTLPTTQQTDIVNQGEFFASTHEDVFDRLTMISQQHAEQLDRALKTSLSDTITPDQLLDSIRQSEQNAVAAAASAAQSFDDFDDRYLGRKAEDPATDNDGQPLIVGALYWSTPLKKMKAWDGSAWAFWSGDISGPPSSTDTAIPVFDGVTGKQLKGSAAKVNATGDVISNGAQVGQSGTASNNFHWRNLLDGLLRLSRGNAGSPITDVMTVNADNSVSFPGNIASGVLGAGQTWQVVSRAWNTTYTNTTGRPIEVKIIGTTLSGTAFNLQAESGVGTGVYINVGVDTGNANLTAVLSCIVPAGHRYKTITTGTPTLQSWLELR